MGKLVQFLADGTTTDVPLDRERITIGRRADNDVCLPYPAVSGEHVAVVTILADSFLEDLGSTNGTLVNGRPVTKHFLADRDLIDIGRQRFTYLANDDAKVDPLPPDIARKLLRGLSEMVEPARPLPQVAVPAGGRRGQYGVRGHPLVADLEREARVSKVATQHSLMSPAAPLRAPSAGDVAPRDALAAVAALPRAAPSPPADVQPRFENQPPADPPPRAAAPTVSDPPPRAGASADPATPAAATAVAAHDSMLASPPPGIAAVAAASAAVETPPRGPSVRVLSGASSGRIVPFVHTELTLGRVGVQVAAVRRIDGGGYRLIPLEGAQPPRINGAPVAPDGSPLHPGDTFEVAGVRLELSVES
ncbi:MAG: FHA domain-containing protein [Burkholderiales bacterium]|nr:FHA domain-containing protein [Burkholderiales bacterium]